MFFIVSKLVGFLMSPLVWVLISLVLALVFPYKRKRFLWTATIVLFVFGNGFLFDELCRGWEAQAKPVSSLPQYEVAVVLGGYSSYDPEIDQVNFYGSSDRVIYGMYLFHLNKVENLLLSGGSGSLMGVDQEGVYMYPFLQDLQIPRQHLFVDSLSKNTYQNAKNTLQILEGHNFKAPILLITSAAHAPRAKACFEKLGVEVNLFAVDRMCGKRKFHFDHLLVPSLKTMMKWNALIHEMVGFAVYKILGYV